MDKHTMIKYLDLRDVEIRITADGSHTLYSRQFKSSYHSVNGAIQESRFIFLNEGLNYYCQKHQTEPVRILESGLGTGLNALLALHYAMQQKKNISYSSIEQYPIGPEIATRLNYLEQLGLLNLREDYLKMHRSAPGQFHLFHPYFSFQWIYDQFESIEYPKDSYDLIFFDPFDASVHPAVWEQAFLERLYLALSDDGQLITYGAKGSFKRALKTLGMQVEGIPGPAGKREITRAIK